MWRPTAIALLLVAIAGCQEEAVAPDVQYREASMHAIGAHMSALELLVGAKVERADDMARHAHALRDLARSARHLFPDGAQGGDAKPEIWQQKDAFESALTQFDRAAEALNEAASTGDREALNAAMNELGGACKGCHDNFKA